MKGLKKDIAKEYSQGCNFLNINRKNLTNFDERLIKGSKKTLKDVQNSIIKTFEKDSFFEFHNTGKLYFYAVNRSLPNELRFDLLNALTARKSYPFLKEAIENSTPTSTIDNSYAKVLETHAYELLSSVFSSSGEIIGKKVFRSDPTVHIIKQNAYSVPALELGYLTSDKAIKSLKMLFGDRIIIETERTEGQSIHRVLTVVPGFGSDYSLMGKFWESKDWTLRNSVITLSWFSLLAKNEFYVNILQSSSELYSTKVKKSLNEIFDQIGRGMV
jgi:hypothetical protein